MKVLAVDTSSLVATVAVMDDIKGILGEYTINHKKTHSQKLMPMLSNLLDSLEIKPGDIDYFASSTGPGSFTGLRIGITTIKAMAYAVNKPVIGIPTLDSLAYNIWLDSGIACPIMDARNNQVYTALYDSAPEIHRITDYMGINIDELIEKISLLGKHVVFNGDGVDVYKDYLVKKLGDRCNFASAKDLYQRASSVAELAIMQAKKGKITGSFSLNPFYLRKSQAEREMEKKIKNDEKCCKNC